MASQGNLKITPEQLPKFELQEASLDTWDRKYRLKSQSGEIIDQDLNDTYARVARALADVEQPHNREKWYEKLRKFSGHSRTVQFQRDESFPMQVLANTNPLPAPSTVLFLGLYRIR